MSGPVDGKMRKAGGGDSEIFMGLNFYSWCDPLSDTISWMCLVFHNTEHYEMILQMTRSFSGSIQINLFSKIKGW